MSKVTLDDLAATMLELGSQMKEMRSDFGGRLTSLETRIILAEATLGGKIAGVARDLKTVKRAVEVIETLPVPYGHPKTYHSGRAEYSSVSGARRH